MSASRFSSRHPATVRIAFICTAEACGQRRFFFSEDEAKGWKCPDHHRSVRQVNKRYVKPDVGD